MTTLAQVVERTRARLNGDRTTASSYLTQPIDESALTIPLESTAGFSRGIAEVGFELVRVDSIDSTSRALKVPPYGRGYRATAASAHPAGTEVLWAPTYPAAVIADELNGVIGSLYPDLYVVRTHTTEVPARPQPVDVPAEATGIIGVWVRDEVRDMWLPEDRWRYDPDSTDDGRTLLVGGHHRPGTRVRIVYSTAPGLFDVTHPDADFEETTGYPERVVDILALGVAARLAPYLDLTRLPASSAEARADGQSKPVGVASTLSRLLNQEFRRRVDDEVRALHRAHPIRVHRTGVR